MGFGSDVRFWHCPVSEHTAVVWQGAIARCEECPITSQHTGQLITRGQADQRQRDIRWLRAQARRVRAAREPHSGILALELPLLPANVLEKVAALLAEAPIGGE